MTRCARTINFSVIFRVIGWLLMIEAGFMLIPVIAALIYDESDLWSFLISAGITLVCGAALTFGLRSGNNQMGKHEGFLLTALVWVFFSIFGMIPFLICNGHIDVSSAFFEAMSGFTTTGCSVLDPDITFSNAINLWRCSTIRGACRCSTPRSRASRTTSSGLASARRPRACGDFISC